MPFRWHVNLPGPVAYSRPMRKKRKGSGPLTSVLVWFIVEPLKLIFKGLAACFRFRPKQAPVPRSYYRQTQAVGWYSTQYGPLWFNGVAWIRPDGRAF